MNAVAVLSRSDEIGVCRLDAMVPLSRSRCGTQATIACGGCARRSSRSQACSDRPPRPWPRPSCRPSARWPPCPPPIANELFLSSDRFRDDDPELPLTAIERDDLLVRFGLFGVRYAVHLLARRVSTGPELARQLLAVSGIDELRRVLTAEFGAGPTHSRRGRC